MKVQTVRAAWAAAVCGISIGWATTGSAQPAIQTPDGATSPFNEWSLGAAGSIYAEWDVFASPEGPNPPDIGTFGFANPAEADVAEQTGTAFITSGGNIYSFAAATDFDVTLPGPGLGSGFSTRFVAQIVTLGNELDPASLRVSYDGGMQEIVAAHIEELGRTELGGFGGYQVTTLFAWDVAGASPSDFLLEFNAAASSMSLANLAVDVYSHIGAFTPLPNAHVPGDYDRSGYVNDDDYLLWRSQYGTAGPDADGNLDHVVDAADYTLWRNNWGAGTPPALLPAVKTSLSAATVPEPTTLAIAIVAVGLVSLGRRMPRGRPWRIQ